MSFALPPIKPKPDIKASAPFEGMFEIPNIMTNGFSCVKTDLEELHPMYQPQKQYSKNQECMNFVILRNTQGLHATLKLSMELKVAKKIGRLPFLPSSNLMHDVLTGRDEEIGPEDIFGTSEFWETSGQPHAVCERHLGIL